MLLTILAFIAVLSLLVFVHELGHFLAAKSSGVRVEEFGFGLPPRILGKKIGETVYSINLLPIGGFLRLTGEDGEYASLGDERSFAVKPPARRALILTSGVIGNFLLGWFLFTILFWVGLPKFSDKVVVVSVENPSPAYEAGVREGDFIRMLDEMPISYFWEVSDYVSEHTDPITVVLEDGGGLRSLIVRPDPYLGVYVSNFVWKKSAVWYRAPWDALVEAAGELGAVWQGIGSLFSNLISTRQVPDEVAGPVGMAQVVGFHAELGPRYLMQIAGVISLNLALVNALPFPALDGGRLMFVIWEVLTKRKVNSAIEARLHQAGMAFLLLLILLITFHDISRFF